MNGCHPVCTSMDKDLTFEKGVTVWSTGGGGLIEN